MLLAT
jgi:cobalt-zinc-cadmium resistance protein CzcA